MDFRRTPRQHELIRPRYERAYRAGDVNVKLCIELDTAIESIRSMLLGHSAPVHELLECTDTIAKQTIFAANKDLKANYTDFHRLCATSVFANERVVMPILFSSDSEQFQQLRSKFCDGIGSKSVDTMAPTLSLSGKDLSRLHTEEKIQQMKRMRGAIQEDTATALLNFDQEDGMMVALPTSFEDDAKRGSDLYLFYMSEGKGYRQNVSIKSSQNDALKDKQNNPRKIVLSATDFHNTNLEISRLLVRQDEGYPGINDCEVAKIETAKQAIREKTFAQMDTRNAQAIELPDNFNQALLFELAA